MSVSAEKMCEVFLRGFSRRKTFFELQLWGLDQRHGNVVVHEDKEGDQSTEASRSEYSPNWQGAEVCHFEGDI